ncbi:MAG: hypothetical protein UV40_C0021G0032 [Parcubacteria group bacterium GW2011_GWA1_42_7]|nr:MAG: hypothetical protein UV34_C0019G0005 [Parcubacteria group bacterium GW2011_GWB1_42_6]KKS69531.1 MAG: hypothetical protein UV40_C0021G0032 [Parcubacteria group bacterium GW2011_GWA1_42_7]KKS91457.1 MAG: hypothetical protein UV67_C0027G0018 [Parcubacteria group bacterium GW2011_GWC1_43_12]
MLFLPDAKKIDDSDIFQSHSNRNGFFLCQESALLYNGFMKNRSFANLAVFAIFFGIALVEALRNQNWLEALLFAALGILSLWADFKKK